MAGAVTFTFIFIGVPVIRVLVVGGTSIRCERWPIGVMVKGNMFLRNLIMPGPFFHIYAMCYFPY